MIEIGVLTSAVELFDKILGIIDRRQKNKKELFANRFKPLYEKLEMVSKEYYAAVQETLAELEKPQPEYSSIRDNLVRRRAGLVLVRNGVLGQAFAFEERFNPSSSTKKLINREELNRKAYEFVRSIWRYFYEGENSLQTHESLMTGLLVDLNILADKAKLSKRTRQAREKAKRSKPTDLKSAQDARYWSLTHGDVVQNAAHSLNVLEHGWTDIAERYADLKLFCEA